jgi:hypothetical protein
MTHFPADRCYLHRPRQPDRAGTASSVYGEDLLQNESVIVWLGEAAADSDQALKEIRVAADEESIRSSHNEGNQQAILALLQRKWFQRIWVRPADPRSRQTLLIKLV